MAWMLALKVSKQPAVKMVRIGLENMCFYFGFEEVGCRGTEILLGKGFRLVAGFVKQSL